MKTIWGVLGAIAAFEYLTAGFELLFGNRKNKVSETDRFITAGNVDEFKPNGVVPFRNGKFYLVRFSDGGFVAMSSKCVHLGCAVQWNETENEFVCPCHSSVFKKNGDVVSPPAARALDLLPVIIENGTVKVNAEKPLRRKSFSESQKVYAES